MICIAFRSHFSFEYIFVLDRVEYRGAYKKDTTKYTMRSYQIQAKEKWNENGQKGFFVMATGTGKTITSLNSVTKKTSKFLISRTEYNSNSQVFCDIGNNFCQKGKTDLTRLSFDGKRRIGKGGSSQGKGNKGRENEMRCKKPQGKNIACG